MIVMGGIFVDIQAPEILMGQRYDRSVDLWSMGTIAYQCLTSSAPFLVRPTYQHKSMFSIIFW